ncbi:MAG: DUF4981 domain-containing protein, partial [Phaeodactylibacter sp.]|nr:DUF4981 domain-containing protein [Phaeodactylibacter sp.]
WDWVDQGLKTEGENGTYWAYGGDLGGLNFQHDENFCANGLVSSNRTPHPGLMEVKKVYQNIQFKFDADSGILTADNLFDFTDLKDYTFKYEVLEEGELVASKDFTLAVAPHQSGFHKIQLPAFKPDREYLLDVYAYTKNEMEMIPAGHEIAREQFQLTTPHFNTQAMAGALTVANSKQEVIFNAGDVTAVFNKDWGKFSRYKKGDMVLWNFPEPYFWRAPTDNDYGNGMPERLGVWRTAHVNKKIEGVEVGPETAAGVTITVAYMLTDIEVPYTVEYLVRPDGSIEVEARIDKAGLHLPEMPRFGMRMSVPAEYDQLEYYGRGPEENYSDRNTATFLGLWEASVSTLKMPYIRPQEYGYHTDTRWIKLSNSAGDALVVRGNQPLSFSALNIRTEALDPGLTKKQQHPTDLRYERNITLHLDLAQRGLGGDNSWGAYPHEPYLLKADQYSYSYVISLSTANKLTN